MRRRIYGISESLSHALEWKTRGGADDPEGPLPCLEGDGLEMSEICVVCL